MFRRLASAFGYGPEPPTDITLQNLQRKYRLRFEKSDYASSRGVTVGFVRDKAGEIIGCPASEIELQQIAPQRGYLSDDSRYLLDYGIKTGDVVLAVQKASHGSTPAPAEPPKPLTEREKVEEVNKVLDRDLDKPIRDFAANPPADKDEREDIHRRLSELVLQQMLKLDNVEVDGDSDLRQFRRQALNRLHGYHQQLDGAVKAEPVEPVIDDTAEAAPAPPSAPVPIAAQATPAVTATAPATSTVPETPAGQATAGAPAQAAPAAASGANTASKKKKKNKKR